VVGVGQMTVGLPDLSCARTPDVTRHRFR
jgi:hypothetical protein